MAIKKKVKQADFEATKTFELTGPDGTKTGVMVTVKSDKCAAAADVKKRLNAVDLSLRLAKEGDEKEDAVMRWIDRRTELNTDLGFLCTVSIDWNGEEWEDGDGGLDLTRENIAKMFAEDWVVVQFMEAIKDLGDFTKA